MLGLTEPSLGPIRTHHSLTTQTIAFTQDGENAKAATHFIGIHFGQGPHEGKMLCAYGRYYDELVLLPSKDGELEGVPGASGVWRIKVRRFTQNLYVKHALTLYLNISQSRRVAFTQRIGDEDIMKEF